jgi:hypothetical protein
MIEVWGQMKGQPKPVLALGHTDMNTCLSYLKQVGLAFSLSKKGRTYRYLNSTAIREVSFHYSDGKFAGSMWIETIPKPMGEPEHAPGTWGGTWDDILKKA